MRTFKDALGNEWTIKITIGTARRIREQMAASEALKRVDFFDYAVVLTSLEDFLFTADLLAVVCADQLRQTNVTSDEFLDALTGESLYGATRAFIEEYVDFFPNPTTRTRMREIVEKIEQINKTRIELIEQKIDETQRLILNAAGAPSGTVSSTESPTRAAVLTTGTAQPSQSSNE
ncbi:MAG: hypothetical protein II807_04350 [Thermoguttaceae bacterium]|nr:hypothetical protein [Thermoguttaceae bacterium]